MPFRGRSASMTVTVYLAESIDGRDELECETVTVSEGLLQAQLAASDRVVVVPLSNVTGIEGRDVETEIDTYPMQGGQYSEFVSRIV